MIKSNKEIYNVDLENIDRIHMIGIGGISMSGIAMMLKKEGKIVTGSDTARGPMIEILENEGIPIFIGSNPEMLENSQLVVYTAAISENDAEYIHAKELGIPTMERAPFLGIMLKGYMNAICIAGMHGKTTTTSIIASALKDINVNPTVLVGSKLKELGNLNYMLGDTKYFVLESCEYVDSFLNFPPSTAVILNIEEEHLDYFTGIENIKESFTKFISLLPCGGNLVICKDDKNCIDILENIQEDLKEKSITVYTYSIIDKTSRIYADNISLNSNGCYSFDCYIDNSYFDSYTLSVPGKHNILNSLATIGVVLANEKDRLKDIKGSIESFTGASRRFEFKKNLGDNILVYDDYAHHPTEIKVTLKSAKDMHPNKVIAVFEPHTYSRTKELLNKFSDAFYDADIAIVSDIYAAREIDDGTISSQILADRLKQNGVNAIYLPSYEEIAKYIHNIMEEGDVIITIGAGNITNLSDLL